MPFSFSISVCNARIGVILTLLLSSINFKISVTSRIPTVSYFTVLDKYAIPALIFLVGLCVYHAIIGSTLFSKVSGKTLVFIDKIALYCIAGIYSLYSLVYLVYFIGKIVKQKILEKKFREQAAAGLGAEQITDYKLF
jgi:hypothetical protein